MTVFTAGLAIYLWKVCLREKKNALNKTSQKQLLLLHSHSVSYHMATRVTPRLASIFETPPGVRQGEFGSSSHPRHWRWLRWP